MRLTALFFSSSELYETPSHSTGTCQKSIVVGVNGGCVPSLYLGILYYTLDIKLNVPWNSCFFFVVFFCFFFVFGFCFFKFKEYYDFVVFLTF